MKRVLPVLFSIFLLPAGCEKRSLVSPEHPCPDLQRAIEEYTEGDLTIRAGCDILITYDLHIRKGKLRVEEDVRFYFKDAGLYVERDGELLAAGTGDKPVLFTSAYLDPLRGDWDGIMVDGFASIDNAIIEYASDGIVLGENVGFWMGNSEVRRNLDYGLRMNSYDSIFDLSRCRFYENLDGDMFLFSDALTLLPPGLELSLVVVDGSDGIIHDGEWQGYTYLLLNDIEISNSARISVKPEAHFYIDTGYAVPAYQIIICEGAILSARGAVFEAYNENYCWGGMVFKGAGDSSLKGVEIYDAGDGGYRANLSVLDSYLEVEDSEIAYSCYTGIYTGDGGYVFLSGSSIHDNPREGIYIDCGGTLEDDGTNDYYSNAWGDIVYPVTCP